MAGVRADVLQRTLRGLLHPAGRDERSVAPRRCRARRARQRPLHASARALERHHAARRARHRGGGRVAHFRRWVLVTIVLGGAFIANQAREWATLDFNADSHAFGSAFYVMTGFHGLHVLAGLFVMVVLLVRATDRRFDSSGHPLGRGGVVLLALRRRGLGGVVGHVVLVEMSGAGVRVGSRRSPPRSSSAARRCFSAGPRRRRWSPRRSRPGDSCS